MPATTVNLNSLLTGADPGCVWTQSAGPQTIPITGNNAEFPDCSLPGTYQFTYTCTSPFCGNNSEEVFVIVIPRKNSTSDTVHEQEDCTAPCDPITLTPVLVDACTGVPFTSNMCWCWKTENGTLISEGYGNFTTWPLVVTPCTSTVYKFYPGCDNSLPQCDEAIGNDVCLSEITFTVIVLCEQLCSPCVCEMAYTNTHDLFSTEFWDVSPLPLPSTVTGSAWTVVSTPPMASVTLSGYQNSIFTIGITSPPNNPPVDRVPIGQYKFRWTFTIDGMTSFRDVCYHTSESIRSRYLGVSNSPTDQDTMTFVPTTDQIFQGGTSLKFETRKCPGAPPVNYGQVGGAIAHSSTTYKLQTSLVGVLNIDTSESCAANGARFSSILVNNSLGGTQLVSLNGPCYSGSNTATIVTFLNGLLAAYNITVTGVGNTFTFTGDVKHSPSAIWWGIKKSSSVLTRGDGTTYSSVQIDSIGSILFSETDTGICVNPPTTLAYTYTADKAEIDAVVNFVSSDLNVVVCTAPCKVVMGAPSGVYDAFCASCDPCENCV